MNNFKVITPAYNCENDIQKTLMSVLGQTYKNWEMIIANDMSTDNTVGEIETFIEKYDISDKVTIINREEKYGEVRNTLDITENLDPKDIVVRLDAGDWLTDLGCFEIINNVYQEYDPAVLWTGHRWAWTTQNISGPIDPNVSLYEQPWRSSHLKTFRVKDFIGLNPKNFKDEEENYIMIACDQAVFLPMMERARTNNRPLVFLPMLMYHYDINLEREDLFHNERSYAQKHSAEWIRKRGYIE
jgi:glycosyltransferase involved in cell wall biosynthesis